MFASEDGASAQNRPRPPSSAIFWLDLNKKLEMPVFVE
jgi:hypothetical protein